MGWFGSDGSDASAQSQTILNVVTRIDTQKDRVVVSVNLAASLAQDVAYDPIPAQLDIQFQKRQNGRAKPIVISTKDASHRDHDLIALVADARRWAGELLEGKSLSI